ncbi:MAG: DNA-binding protein [Candidatus Methanoperedens sp.]|nr:DNA-binding protein [Candidatus Methanoperedens sp.]
MENIIDREVAWRIFAYEFNRSNLYYSEGDERAPNYIITPTGVKCNRLFIVGVVTEIENIGAENNLWRARIADPTGVFTVYAGQYQPEAAIFLSELSVPAYVAVVGKARKYEPEEGSVYTSIRPEEINYADEKLRDRWVLDTAERTLERIRVMEDALSSGLSGNELKDYLLRKGTNAVLADGMVRAISHYKNLDKVIAELKRELIRAVETVLSERVKTGAPEQQVEKQKAEELKEVVTEPQNIPGISENVPDIPEAPAKIEPKEVLAGIIERLDTGKGTSYSMVIEAAVSSGIDAESTEESIKELMAEGRCYEPKIGVLRKV